MKLVLKLVGGIIALVVIALVLFVTLINPNQFKPPIESLAKDQGIALQLNGDLSWAFWPSLGVNIVDVKVAALATPDQPIAELQGASLMLALMPLLHGEFRVNHVLVDGAAVHLAVDKNGKGNWEALSKPSTPTSSSAASASAAVPAADNSSAGKALNLEVERISLHNASLDYRDPVAGQSINLSDLNLDLVGVNTRGAPFNLDLSWVLQMVQQAGPTQSTQGADKLQLAGKLHSAISVDQGFNNLTLTDGQLKLTLSAKKSVDVALNYSLTLKDLQNNLSYQGKLELASLDLRQVLAAFGTELQTANDDALKNFALSTELQGDAKQAQLNNLALTLDKTHFKGTVAAIFASQAHKLDLQGDSINVDDYLPPKSDTPETAQAAPAEDTPLPLEALRQLNLDARLGLQQMQVNNLQLAAIKLVVKAKNGLIDQSLNAQAYQGAIAFNSHTDARAEQAKMNFDGGVQGFELEPFLKALKPQSELGLSGAIQARAQGNSSGASVNQLVDAMDATASFSGAQVRMSPLNIEQQFCKLVNMISQTNSEEVTWDAFTEMRQLNGNVVWKDKVIELQSFNAGVSQLLLASTGQINLGSGKYEFKLPFKLTEASANASLKGCSIGSENYWLDRSLSLLRCKGSFAAINPVKDCGFDKSGLASLTKDFAEFKLREKHGAKIDAAEQKLKDKKQELLDKANAKIGGEEKATKPKDLLNNFLKKKLGGESTSSSSAASSK